MKNTHFKTILREIRHSFGRFAAIIAIVALGTGFLVGLLSSTPDMKTALNRYYRQESMPDFTIKSTMGLTQKDLKKTQNQPYVRQVMPARVIDENMTAASGEEMVGRICGMPLSKNQSDEFLSDLTLLDGRMPEKRGECLLQNPNSYLSDLTIGDTLTLSKYDRDTFDCRKFTIVGIVKSPYYFCDEKEPSSVGTGRVGAILYTNPNAFSMDVYTDFFVSLKQSAEYDTFSEEYIDYAENISGKLEDFGENRCDIRYKALQAEGKKELRKARNKLDEERRKAENQLNSALSQLNQGRRELDNGTKQLESAKQELVQGQQQLDNGAKQLENSKKKLDQSADQVQQAKDALNAGMEIPDSAKKQIEQYDRGVAQYNAGVQELHRQQQALKNASYQISANEENLRKAEQQLAQGSSDYYEAKSKADAELAKGDRKIRKAERELKEMDYPQWYILDRSSNVSYARYKIDVEKVADIATVFPIFFFLVAALVSLTTMTRMVEEERTQIGTLKALGYSKGKIISKYMLYCGTATVLGCILGLVIGINLLPTVIYEAYRAQYDLPDLILEWHWPYILSACALEAACTLGATYFACRRSLKEKPALLMLPRAPKAGKRIILERIKPLWNHMSFSHKATARNIFRYKKHLFMTVIGIAGCTALILTGLGLKDSMSNLARTQYQDILHYDMTISLKEKAIDSQVRDFLNGKESLLIHQEVMTAESGSRENPEEVSVTIQVPRQNEKLSSMVRLYNRVDKKYLPFNKDSVVMTEKMADTLGLSKGDTFLLRDGDEKEKSVTLTEITENYVGCYLYMGTQAYENIFGAPDYNGFLVRSGITDLTMQDEASASLMEIDSVSAVSFTSQEQSSYENILSSVNFIILVLVFCAGALAVVVLYNLTNININERTKELATLKVLGYYPGEVAQYVFREITILTVLGTVTGLILGIALHRYVILTAETTNMMMGREISPVSFLLSAAITLLFSAVVDFLMIFKLKKIEMVESMKAVD